MYSFQLVKFGIFNNFQTATKLLFPFVKNLTVCIESNCVKYVILREEHGGYH